VVAKPPFVHRARRGQARAREILPFLDNLAYVAADEVGELRCGLARTTASGHLLATFQSIASYCNIRAPIPHIANRLIERRLPDPRFSRRRSTSGLRPAAELHRPFSLFACETPHACCLGAQSRPRRRPYTHRGNTACSPPALTTDKRLNWVAHGARTPEWSSSMERVRPVAAGYAIRSQKSS
jgi:hypothetical protein